MMSIKYIYTDKGQQEAIIVPIEFWNDIFKKFELKQYLNSGNYFISKYSEILSELHISEKEANKEDFYSLFGTWQSDKTGDEIINEIYSSRNDKPSNIIL